MLWSDSRCHVRLYPGSDLIEWRSWSEDGRDSGRLQMSYVALGNDSSTKDEDVAGTSIGELLDDLREQGLVCTGEGGEANCIDVLLDRSLRDLGRSLMKSRVDHFETGVTQSAGDDLGASVVTVETWLGNEDSSWHARCGG